MEGYIEVVGKAFLTFLFCSVLITLPFLIFHYRKYGSVTFMRFFLIYSFVFYCLSAYFLVILPLPSQEEVAALSSPTVQLIPFSFFRELPLETGFHWNEPSTYFDALVSYFTLQYVFNIALLFPLGFYLRYFFRRNLAGTLLFCFGVSLFFEITQFSGLYGMYPRPYRLFDVDDLICNTLGGLIGYAFTGLLMKILPSRDEIDEKAYEKGERVTSLRRLLAFVTDMICMSFFGGLLSIPFSLLSLKIPYFWAIVFLLYFVVLQWMWGGKTIGKRLTKVRVVNQDGSPAVFWRILLRYGIILAIYFVFEFLSTSSIVEFFRSQQESHWIYLFAVCFLCLALLFVFLVETVLNHNSKTGRDYFPGRISGTRVVSTVVSPPTKRRLKQGREG